MARKATQQTDDLYDRLIRPLPLREKLQLAERIIADAAAAAPAEPFREEARERMLARMRSGVPLGGPPYPTREEIHNRGHKP